MTKESQAPLEERVVELEMRLSFQEDTLLKLNQVVSDQDQLIMRLQEHLRAMSEKMSDMEYSLEQGGTKSGSEKPPHY